VNSTGAPQRRDLEVDVAGLRLRMTEGAGLSPDDYAGRLAAILLA
jgi:hypothetical protein